MTEPPTFGRPSPAAERPGLLRAAAAASDASYQADGGDNHLWRVRAATVAGVRHRLAGRRGEDAFAWAQRPAGLVVAVADGVSATPEAALAARVAVSAACGVGDDERAPSVLCEDAIGAAHDAVLHAVGDAANGATTLVVAVVAADGAWAVSRVGDSDAQLLGTGGWRPLFAARPDDDVRSGATDALPAVVSVREDAMGRLSGGEAMVLMSDGIAGPLRDGPSTVAQGLAEGLVVPPSPLQLARLVDFARQGCHDDRTLLAVWLAGDEG